MKKLFLTIIIYSMVIGTMAVAVNLMFGVNTVSYIANQRINGVNLYTFDFKKYLDNIIISIQNTTRLELKSQTRTWSDVDIINNLAYILNTLILGLNILIYPIRVSCYLGKAALSIIGINTAANSGLSWLINTINFLLGLQIPYV